MIASNIIHIGIWKKYETMGLVPNLEFMRIMRVDENAIQVFSMFK
jgi:hypothetical protein